jgi:Zn-dependent metalloprotease
MHATHSCRHGLHCFLPPYLLEHLGQITELDIALWLNDTRRQSQTLRGLRMGFDPWLAPTMPAAVAVPAEAGKNRAVYDAQSKGVEGLPGRLVRSEGEPSQADPAVDEAYDHSGLTWDFYSQRFSRDSLDDKGLALVSSVHVGKNLNNAFWTGQQMAYGDGDGKLFTRFTRSLDVVGHELAHGVVTYTANLVYQNESGALNEHFADVFGMLTRQWHEGTEVKNADWLVGKDIMGPAATARSLRTFRAEKAYENDRYFGTDPQPKQLRDQYRGSDDNGGVHINSGIPNHAFFLFATALGGKAWERAGGVWYESLLTLPSEAQFTDMVLASEKTAVEQHGRGSSVHQALMAAWKGVGF